MKRGREDLTKNYNIPPDKYPRRGEAQISTWERLRNELENPDTPLEVKRSINLCAVDKNGVQPIQIGRIPSHLAARMQTNINVQGLTLEAIIQQDPQRIYHAAMLDPHTAAELIWIRSGRRWTI